MRPLAKAIPILSFDSIGYGLFQAALRALADSRICSKSPPPPELVAEAKTLLVPSVSSRQKRQYNC